MVTAGLCLLMVTIVFSTRAATVTRPSNVAASLATAALDQGSSFSFTVNGDYPVLATLELYGFEHLAEPCRITTLVAQGSSGGSNTSYLWTVSTQSGEIDGQYTGVEVTHIFTRVSETYIVTLCEVDPHGPTVRSVNGKVTCKYVRRDTHRTSAEDRERYLNALRLMYDLQGPAGREIYGPKYTGIHEINVMHLDRFSQLRCTPWHGGDVFLTSHQAFVLMVEQSLQAIDPRISQPYWDFAYEATMGKDKARSPMLSAEWFGSYGTEETNYEIPDGIFRGIELPSDCSRPEKNSYCRLTTSYNNDPGKVLARANSVCGMKTTVGWPSCDLLREMLAPANYTETVTKMNDTLHSALHMQLGGTWDCPFSADLAMALSPGNSKLLRFIDYVTVQNIVAIMQSMVTNKLIQCPESCAEGTPFEDCLCYCPQMHKDLAAGLSLFNASLNILEVAQLVDLDSLADALGCLPTDEAREALIVWFAGSVCTPGKYSSSASPLSSPMDPVFAPTHAFYDYVMQGKMLLIGEEGLEMDWYNDDICWGHEWLAQLPFRDFEDEHNKQYTNQDLQKFFRPNNPSLPYVYDDYSFEHCGNVNVPM